VRLEIQILSCQITGNLMYLYLDYTILSQMTLLPEDIRDDRIKINIYIISRQTNHWMELRTPKGSLPFSSYRITQI
jgi:hypothetical protein